MAVSAGNSVAGDLAAFHFLESNHRLAALFVDVEHLAENGTFRIVASEQGVAEEEGEGFVSDEGPPVGDRIAESVQFLLPDEVDVGHVGDMADLFEELGLPLFLEFELQFGGAVEVLLDRPLASTNHHQDFADSTPDAFFDDVLDGGSIDDGQHFLGLRLGRGKETRAKARGGDDGLGNGHG